MEIITFRKWRKNEAGLIDPWLPGRTPVTVAAMIAPLDKPMAIGSPGEAVTGADCLRALNKKFVSRSFQVESPVDDAAVQGVSLARLADDKDRPGVRDFVFDLHLYAGSP
jgi:hypothetical protein